MLKLLLVLIFSAPLASFCFDGNLCTVQLFSKGEDLNGDVIPKENLGHSSSYELEGVSDTSKELYKKDKETIFYKGQIDYLGFFEISFWKKKDDKSKPQLLLESRIYYSPYDSDKVSNLPSFVNFSDYVSVISCIASH